MVTIAKQAVAEATFIEAMLAIIIAWILVALWQRVIDNFAYNRLGLDHNSTFHAFIVALVATVILISFTFSVSDASTDVIVGDTTGALSPGFSFPFSFSGGDETDISTVV